MEKNYILMNYIGVTKYVVNFHDGESTHRDGSPFYDIECFNNRKKMLTFIKGLEAQGYRER